MAIDYAHQRGVIHGDIKPANILLDKQNISLNLSGEPNVTDFGMDKMLGGVAASTSGSLNATALYISPEQVMGSPATARSVLYSLRIILYPICTRTPPFLRSKP